MKPTDCAVSVTNFLGDYLPTQRNVSPNTVKAYRDAFTLLLRYFQNRRGVAAEKVTLDRIDATLILDFLDHLENERNCGPRTRNNRLSAMHSFFRYLQTEVPDRMIQCQRVLAIPLQRCAQPAVVYLSAAELAAILAQPDLANIWGRRDAVLLSVLYDTAARVQELVDLSVRDLRLDWPSQLTSTGNRTKIRVVRLLS